MTFVSVSEIAIGAAVVLLWSMLIATHQVPEIEAHDRAIWFHLVAEFALGLFLVASGAAVLVAGATVTNRALAAAAAGGLVYSTVNSPGYYAQQGRWMMVGAFGVLAALGVAMIGVLAHP
jgi:hypothetical protein